MSNIRPASLGFALLLALAGTAEAQEPGEVLAEHGCLACHSTDGSAGPGPTFQGLFGRSATVVTGGETHTVVVDEAYVARAIREPGHDVVVGYAAMPDLAVADAEVDAMVDALRELPEEEARPRTIVPLALAALGFAFLHLFLSWHPIRRRLRARLGKKGFEIGYSVGVGIPFGLIFLGWWLRPFVPLWELGDWTRWIPLFVMPFAFILMVAGYSTKSPTAAGKQELADSPPTGILTITRHPALWGFALWALCHIPANGDLASLLLFASFASLALLGMVHIDRRRARELGERWEKFAAQTSVLPFVALITAKTKLDLTGLWWRALVGLGFYVFMLSLHEREIGVSPFPYW